ncbi:MAG: septum formation initiator family protein [Candidatus Portnoybacteria bacterium]|nr:septum formation initiator family protein [Candidatus Portnoybacteria bacterium]
MNEFKDKILTSKLLLFFLLLLLIYAGIACVRATYKKYQMVEQNNQLQAQIVFLQQENSKLNALKEFFTNKNFLEKEAKQRLNLKKEGENVVILPEPEVGKTSSSGVAAAGGGGGATTVASQNAPGHFWKKWWDYLFKQ